MLKDPSSLKALRSAIPLLRADRPEAVVVAPDEDDDALSAGGACAEFLGHVFGRTLPVLRESDYERAKRYRGRGIVAVGALGSHRMVTRLYLEGRHYCDHGFPGPGGFVLRTIHHAVGEGIGVLLVCGGGAEGWDSAAEAFCDLLTYLDERATVPSTHLVQSAAAPAPLDPSAVPDTVAHLIAHLREHPSEIGAASLLDCALRYDAWGDPAIGIVLREVLTRLLRAASGDPRTGWHSMPELWLGPFSRIWRNLEERPIFEGPIREEISRFLWRAAAGLAERWKSPADHEVLDATVAGAASGLWWAGRYFEARHGLAEGAAWQALAEKVAGLPRLLLPISEKGAASQAFALREYLWLCPFLGQGTRLGPTATAAAQWLCAALPAAPRPARFGGSAATAATMSWLAGWTSWAAEAASLRLRVQAPDPAHLGLHPGSFYRPPPPDAPTGETAIAVLTWDAATVAWVSERSGRPLPDDPHTELLCSHVALRRRTGSQGDYLLFGASPPPYDPEVEAFCLLRCDLGGETWLWHPGRSLPAREDGHRWCALTGRLHAGRIRLVALRTLDADRPVARLIVAHAPDRGFLVLRSASAGAMPPLCLGIAAGVEAEQEWPEIVRLRIGSRSATLRALGREPAPPLRLVEPTAVGARHVALEGPPARDDGAAWQALEFSLAGAEKGGGWVRGGAAPGPLLCSVAGQRRLWMGIDWNTLGLEGPIEVRTEAWVLGGFLGFAGLERLAIGDLYIEASTPCEVLLDPVEQAARITAAAPTELFLATGEGRESALLRPGATFDTPFAYAPEIHAALVERAREIAPEEAFAHEGSHRGDDAGDGPADH